MGREARGGRTPRRVVVLTTWFPSDDRPTQAPFNLRHAEAIGDVAEVRVLHVRFGATGRAADEVYHGVRVRRLPLSARHPLTALATLAAVRRAVRSSDVVHTMAFSSIGVLLAAAPFGRTPWVHTEHWSGVAHPEYVSPRWRRLAWLRGVLRAPARLTAVSRQLADVLVRFSSAERVSVVPCVVENPEPVSAPPASPPLELVSVGGIVEGKQPLVAVRTLRWLADQGVDARLTWVGDGPMRAEMEREAGDLQVADRVRITGFVDPDDVFGYYARARVFFGPTRSETFFAAAAEALSAGRPVVAADVGGFTDYVSEANGVIVDELSPASFGSGILLAAERFEDVPPERIATPFRSRFSRSAIAGSFDAVYRAAEADPAAPYAFRLLAVGRSRRPA